MAPRLLAKKEIKGPAARRRRCRLRKKQTPEAATYSSNSSNCIHTALAYVCVCNNENFQSFICQTQPQEGAAAVAFCVLHINQWCGSCNSCLPQLLPLLLLIIISRRLCERCPRAIIGVETTNCELLSGSSIDIDMKAISSQSDPPAAPSCQLGQQPSPAPFP